MASKNCSLKKEKSYRGIRVVPAWVADLVEEKGGIEVFFVAAKKIENSDLNRQQNRFLLPRDSVQVQLAPVLSEPERAAANLLADGGHRSQLNGEVGQCHAMNGKKVLGREHGGLPVTVFTKGKFRCHLWLTRWDSNQETILKGDELKIFKAWSSFEQGDEVEIWGFRLAQGGKLCFAIGRSSSSSSSSSSSPSS